MGVAQQGQGRQQWLKFPAPGNRALADCDVEFVLQLARAQIMLNASAFERRVVAPLQSWPHRFLLLGKQPDGAACNLRMQIAQELLGTPAHDLEVNARKMKALFHADLLETARSGLLTGRLRVCVRTVGVMWKADSRECERINKMLKLFTERGPTSSAELVSSRACIKHYLGEAVVAGATELRRKWSHYRPNARRLLEVCLESWQDRKLVQSEVDRWIQPPPPPADKGPQLPSEKECAVLWAKLHPFGHSLAHKWAACYNMILKKQLACRCTELGSDGRAAAAATPVIALGFKPVGQRESSFQYFVVAEKVRSVHRLAPCVVSHDRQVSIQKPISFRGSTELLASYWESTRKRGVVKVFWIPLQGAASTKQTELSALGKAGTPQTMFHLNPPSRRVKKRLIQGDEKSSSKRAASADQDHDSDAHDPDDDGSDKEDVQDDEDLTEGINMLLEEAEEEFGDDASTGGQHDDTESDLLRVALAFKSGEDRCHEDDLDEEDVSREQKRDLSEHDVTSRECRRAKEAVDSGICSEVDLQSIRHTGMDIPGLDMDPEIEATADVQDLLLEGILNSEGGTRDTQNTLMSAIGSRGPTDMCLSYAERPAACTCAHATSG
eukprot:s2385_g11.t1